ncbi:hypothetical protein [Candidatus Palauibacter sp.]|uniref:hypothetical protein n=1 Tax=Candidatus Palauibacter sp. TaxID=3101350 RepID=UPI003B0170DB
MPNLATLLLLSAGALDAGGGLSHDEGLKCAPRKDGPPDLPEVVVMVDGELVATERTPICLRWG